MCPAFVRYTSAKREAWRAKGGEAQEKDAAAREQGKCATRRQLDRMTLKAKAGAEKFYKVLDIVSETSLVAQTKLVTTVPV